MKLLRLQRLCHIAHVSVARQSCTSYARHVIATTSARPAFASLKVADINVDGAKDIVVVLGSSVGKVHNR